MCAPVAVDWFRLLWDLMQRGHNLQTISNATGIGRTTLRGYLAESQPPHWRGERLIALWCLTCQSTRDKAPTVELSLSPRVVHPKCDVQPEEQAVAALDRVWR